MDDDPDGAQLNAAIASRRELDLVGIARGIEYRDDEWASTGMTLGDVSPYSAREAIESSGTPTYVWVSWRDSGTAEGALSRYQTLSNPQTGNFHVYLEDVAPDGRVTYITEGVLRAIHRRVSDGQPPYQVPGPYYRSYERADAAPLEPGEVAELRFNLYPTSVLIQEGHRLRVAIAGHDASVFDRYPAQGTPLLSVGHNSAYPSRVELPMR